MDEINITKVCTKCKKVKSLIDFYPSPAGRNGREPRCIICHREKGRLYQHTRGADKRKEYNEYKKCWSKENPEKLKTYRERCKEKRKAYYKKRGQTDLNYKIKRNLRGRLRHALNGEVEECDVIQLLGRNIHFFY